MIYFYEQNKKIKTKTKMDIKKIIKKFVFGFVFFPVAFGLVVPDAHYGAFAEESFDAGDAYPYTEPFVISAYYSPLPCQSRYVTGSYEGDIRLNGSGVNGADGTPVYPGMIAAPRTYSFGTKMHIPEVGIVAVHDRGGAIVTAGNRNQAYDRLDIWMGYGDKGLKRALNWGKRTVDVTVYGISDSVIEDIDLYDYSEEEAVPGECTVSPNTLFAKSEDDFTVEKSFEVAESSDDGDYDTKLAMIDDQFKMESTQYMNQGLGSGSDGDSVVRLQTELKSLNFYRAEVTGVYDDLTAHAVMKFQQSQGIVSGEGTHGAGYFGPKTRGRLNEIIGSRNYTMAVVAQTTYEANKRYIAEL